VKVLNINEGKNAEVVNRCRKLAEYTRFIGRIYDFWEEHGNLEDGIKNAIKYCSRHGILSEYLEIHGSEVLNMILTEWNTEDAIAYARQEGVEDGKAEEKFSIARNLLTENMTPEFVQKVTGLDAETIQRLNN